MYRKQLQQHGLGLERHSSMPEITRDEYLEKKNSLQRKSSFQSTESLQKRNTKTKVSSRLLQPTASSVRKQKDRKQFVSASKKTEVRNDRVIKTSSSGYSSQTSVHYGDKSTTNYSDVQSHNKDHDKFYESDIERSTNTRRSSISRDVQSDSEGVYKPIRIENKKSNVNSNQSQVSYYNDSKTNYVNEKSDYKTFSSFINENNFIESESESKQPLMNLGNFGTSQLMKNQKTTIISSAKASLHESKTFQYVYTIDAELSYREYNKLMTIIAMLQEQKRKWEDEVQEIRDKLEKTGKEKMQLAHNNHILRQSLEAANRAIKEINGKVQELKQSLIPLREENSQLRDEKIDRDDKISKLKQENMNSINESHQLKKEKSSLDQKLNLLENEYEKYKTTMHEKFRNLEETYRVYKCDMEKSNTQNLDGIDELREENESLTIEINSIKLDYKRMASELEKAKVFKENLEYQNSNLQADHMHEIEKIKNDVNKEKNQLKDQMQELKIELEKRRKNIDEIENEKNNILNDFQDLKNELKNSSDSNSNIEKLCEMEREKSSRLQNELTDMRIELQQLDEIKMRFDDVTEEKISLNEKVAYFEERNDHLKSTNESLAREITSLKHEIQSFHNQLESSTEQETVLIEKSRVMQNEISQYKEQIIMLKNLKNENEASKHEVERLEKRLASAQQQITDVSISNQQSVAANEQLEIEFAKLQRKLNERPSEDYLNELREEISRLQVDVNESNKLLIEETSLKEETRRELEETTSVFELEQQFLKNENTSLRKQLEKLTSDITDIDREKRQEISEKERCEIELALMKRELERKPSDNETEQWKSEITQLRMEINDANRNIDMEISEKEKLENEIKELQNKYEGSSQLQENQIENLKKQIKELTQNVANLDKEKQNEISDRKHIEYQLDQTKRELNRKPSDSEISSFKNEISQLQIEISETNFQLNSKISENENLSIQISDMKEKITALENGLTKERDEFTNRMNRMTDNMGAVTEEKQNESTNRKRLELELEQIKRELNRKPSDSEISNWKSEISRLRSEISDITKLKYQETMQKEHLKNEHEELQSKFNLQKQLNENEISSLKEQTTRLKIDINEIDTQKHAEITQRQILERELTLLKNELKRKPQDKEMKQWHEEISRLKNNISELTKQKNEEKMKKDKLQIEIDNMMNTTKTDRVENKKYVDEINKLKIKVIQIDEEKNSEKKEKLKYIEELNTLKASMNALREKKSIENEKSMIVVNESIISTQEINNVSTAREDFLNTLVISEENNNQKIENENASEKSRKTSKESKNISRSYTKLIDGKASSSSTDLANMISSLVEETTTYLNERDESFDSKQIIETKIDGNKTKNTTSTEEQKALEKKRKMKEIEEKIKKKREQGGIWSLKTPSIDSLNRKSSESLDHSSTKQILNSQDSIITVEEKVRKRDRSSSAQRSHSADPKKYEPVGRPLKTSVKRERGRSPQRRDRSISSENFNNEQKQNATRNNVSKNSIDKETFQNSNRTELKTLNRSTSQQNSTQKLARSVEISTSEMSLRERRKQSEERRNERLKNQSSQQDSSNESQEELREKRQRRRSKGRSKENLEKGETYEREDFLAQAMIARQHASTKKPGMRPMQFRENDHKDSTYMTSSKQQFANESNQRESRDQKNMSRDQEYMSSTIHRHNTTSNSKGYQDQRTHTENHRDNKTHQGNRDENTRTAVYLDEKNRIEKANTYVSKSNFKSTNVNKSNFKGTTVNKSNFKGTDITYGTETTLVGTDNGKEDWRRFNDVKTTPVTASGKYESVNGATNTTKTTMTSSRQTYGDNKTSKNVQSSKSYNSLERGKQKMGVDNYSSSAMNNTHNNSKNISIATELSTENKTSANTYPRKISPKQGHDVVTVETRETYLQNRNFSINEKSPEEKFNVTRSYTYDPNYATVNKNSSLTTNSMPSYARVKTSGTQFTTKRESENANGTVIETSITASPQRQFSEMELEQMRRMEEARKKVLLKQSMTPSEENDTSNNKKIENVTNISSTKKVERETSHSAESKKHSSVTSKHLVQSDSSKIKNIITIGGQPLKRDSQENIDKTSTENVAFKNTTNVFVEKIQEENVSSVTRNNSNQEIRKESLLEMQSKEITSFPGEYHSYRSLPRNMKPLQQSISKQISTTSQKHSQSTNALTRENLDIHQSRSYRDIKLHENMQRRNKKLAQYKDNSSANRLSAFSNDSLGGFSQVTFATLSDEGKQYDDYATQYDGSIKVKEQFDGTSGVNKQYDGTSGVNKQYGGSIKVNNQYDVIKVTEQYDRTSGVNKQYGGTGRVNNQYDGSIKVNNQYGGSIKVTEQTQMIATNAQHGNFHERDILKLAGNIPKGHSKFNCEKCRELNLQRRGNQPIRFCWERYFPISESTPQPSMQSLLMN